MAIHPRAGKPAPKESLVDQQALERAYYETKPNLDDPKQLVSFGTSGHRGKSLNGTFTEAIVITPSHNPPEDRGFKYNPPNGGPAETDVTKWIQDRANAILRGGNHEVKRLAYEKAIKAPTTHQRNLLRDYVAELKNVID